MQAEQALSLLETACEAEGIRLLDKAFAQFLADLEPQADGLVLLAAALVSKQLGHGHICLDLDALSESDDWIGRIEPAQWLQALSSCSLVAAGQGSTPLVLVGSRLYLRRYWQYEVEVADGILSRVEKTCPLPDDLPQQLSALFPNADSEAQTVDWQKIACALAVRKAFTVITGGPGTGKTTTVLKLLALLQNNARQQGRNLRIQLAAPTGKAAARLSESISASLNRLPEAMRDGILQTAGTLHKLLGVRPGSRHFVHGRHNPLHAEVVIVDEASMVDLEMMAALLQALRPETRLILLGDKDQLASVEAGSVLGDVCSNAGQVGYDQETVTWLQAVGAGSLPVNTEVGRLDQQIAMLRVSHRFGQHSGIGQLAAAVNAGQAELAQSLWHETAFEDLRRFDNFQQFDSLVVDGWGNADALGYRHYLQLLQQLRPANDADSASFDAWADAVLSAFDQFQLLSALRQGDWGVESLNRRIAELLHRQGLIAQTHGWYEGRPVLVNRNDYSLGLMNGDIGIALLIPDATSGESRLRVVFRQSQQAIKQVLPSRLNAVEDVYAMTVHKSQGSEFGHVALALPEQASPLLTRELIYTGITRAKSRFSLFCSHDQVLSQAIGRRVTRAGGLRELLQ
jgi:exodeoxyribonuclease V alpha subunit